MDALSFFVSGYLLHFMRTQEPPPEPRPAHVTVYDQIREGLLLVWKSRVLRWIGLLLAAWQFFHVMFIAIFVLFAVREVGLAAGTVGLVFSMGGVGFLIGSLTVGRITERLALGPVMLCGMFATTFGWGIVSLAHGTRAWRRSRWEWRWFSRRRGWAVFLDLHQPAPSDHAEPLLGRVISTMRWVAITGTPLGALLGGRWAKQSACAYDRRDRYRRHLVIGRCSFVRRSSSCATCPN